MIQRDRERDREQTERETERAELVTFLGQVPGMMGIHNSVTFDSVHDTHEMIRTRKIVGHICGIPGARRFGSKWGGGRQAPDRQLNPSKP